MWFIADLFERYTNNVAKTFIKLAAMEAEANRQALDQIRAKRQRQYAGAGHGELISRPPMVHPRTGEPLDARTARRNAVHKPKGFADAQPSEIVDPGALLKKRLKSALTELPLGVRGEVVVKYVDGFIGATESEIGDLLDKLRKDKKVRVAELQMIVAAVLDEEPTMRRKADHLAVLRRHLLAPFDRDRPDADALRVMHAAE